MCGVTLFSQARSQVVVEPHAGRHGRHQLAQGPAEGVGQQEVRVGAGGLERRYPRQVDAHFLRRGGVQLKLFEDPALELMPDAPPFVVGGAKDACGVASGEHVQEEGVLGL